VSITGQPYAFAGADPVNRTDAAGLYISGGGSSACNTSSGTLYCAGSTSDGESVAGSYNPSTGVKTGGFAVPVTRSTGASGTSHSMTAVHSSLDGVAQKLGDVQASADAATVPCIFLGCAEFTVPISEVTGYGSTSVLCTSAYLVPGGSQEEKSACGRSVVITIFSFGLFSNDGAAAFASTVVNAGTLLTGPQKVYKIEPGPIGTPPPSSGA
jgi:hypothetical protein